MANSNHSQIGRTAAELASQIGQCWGTNVMDEFTALLHEDAQIVHPFFREVITPLVAAYVLNATVHGSTTYRGLVSLAGDGRGVDDLIDMYFDETGDAAGYEPNYIGRMAVRGEIRNHRFRKLVVKGYELIHRRPASPSTFPRIDVGKLNASELTRCLGESWGKNDMPLFTSLFAEDGIIMHPLFASPITPQVAADVLNSAMRGMTIPRPPRLLVGDGKGELDVVEMYFDETGLECGELPEIMGVMVCTAKIVRHRIQELFVHGYTVTESRFKNPRARLLHSSAPSVIPLETTLESVADAEQEVYNHD